MVTGIFKPQGVRKPCGLYYPIIFIYTHTYIYILGICITQYIGDISGLSESSIGIHIKQRVWSCSNCFILLDVPDARNCNMWPGTVMYEYKAYNVPFIGSEHGKLTRKKVGTIIPSSIFPECVARVPVSLWGSGGWGCVRSTLRSRAQPSATVRARTIWPCLWEVLQRW